MEWVASTLHATSEYGVSSITTADAHTSAAGSRLNGAPAYLNGLVRFAERRNLVSTRVPSHFKRSLRSFKASESYYPSTQRPADTPVAQWKPHIAHLPQQCHNTSPIYHNSATIHRPFTTSVTTYRPFATTL
jgi:hypothetical protein